MTIVIPSIFVGLIGKKPHNGFKPENNTSRPLVLLIYSIMSGFVIRSAGLDGWHLVGSLRTEVCAVSKPVRMPQKRFNRKNAQRLQALRGRILSGQFVTPKLESVNTVFVLGE